MASLTAALGAQHAQLTGVSIDAATDSHRRTVHLAYATSKADVHSMELEFAQIAVTLHPDWDTGPAGTDLVAVGSSPKLTLSADCPVATLAANPNLLQFTDFLRECRVTVR